MGDKHLHELLNEDQEPFHIKNFIADRRSLLKSTTTNDGKTTLQLKKQNRLIEFISSSTTARNFCINHACLFSFQDSPEFRKSPFLDFATREMKSPCNNAGVFLHIPARTAAMLLDAATRIEKPKAGSKHIGSGLLGSFLKRLKDRNTRTKGREIGQVNVTSSSRPTRRIRKKCVNGAVEVNGGDWSEKSSEMEISCCSRSVHYSEESECFCSNPSSPFHFALQRIPSPPRRKPESSSPVASPSRHFQQDKESCDDVHPLEIYGGEDEEKEQCSPVSTLDPFFDDDEEENNNGVMEENHDDIECSYANVQRAKHQLLEKLQRFERLAGLDPIELEKYMFEQSDNDDEEDGEEAANENIIRETVNHLGLGKIPWYMKKLMFDLIKEENKNEERQVVVQKVCKRLHSWKAVELNTIDMMVETDLISEGWKRCDEEKIKEFVVDIEGAIFRFLMEELTEEIVYSSGKCAFYQCFKNRVEPAG